MKEIQGGVCAAEPAFLAGAVHSGIQQSQDEGRSGAHRLFLARDSAAAVYTRNQVKADPLQVTKAAPGAIIGHRAIIAQLRQCQRLCARTDMPHAVRANVRRLRRYLGHGRHRTCWWLRPASSAQELPIERIEAGRPFRFELSSGQRRCCAPARS